MVMTKDLKDQIGIKGVRPLLKCWVCGQESSANKGDYFNYRPDHVFTCCDEPMLLVTKEIVYKEVK